jgi:adenosylhomocysteine nucleosidase
MIGFVVGLEAEAQIARAFGCPVAVGGGGAAGAAQAASALIAQGITQLVSFGLAGGLQPGLPAGAILVPERVIDEAGTVWSADRALADRFGVVRGTMLAVPDIIAAAAAKAALWQQTGALAADIESGAVARAGLGFAVLRVVCDPAERNLPPAALTALDEAGRIKPMALLRSLARRPGQIAGLITLGRDAAAARRALLAEVRRIGPLSPS